VAYRIAAKTRGQAARRRVREQEKKPMLPVDPIQEVVLRELRPVLDEEVNRLPEKYRHPIILCYLQNKTNGEAARQLGWTKGTVSGRLARARQLLRTRLARRGVVLSFGILPLALVQEAGASVPPTLGMNTVKAALLVAASQTAAGTISAPVAAMLEGALKTMFLAKLRVTLSALLAFVLLSFGAFLITQQVRAARPASGEEEDAKSRKLLEGDLGKLQGTWVGETLEKDGEPAPAKWQFLVKGFRVVIGGNLATVFSPGSRSNIATFTIDADKAPKQIDFRYIKGPARGQKIPGIYALKKNRLHLCMPEEEGKSRATGFVAKEHSGLLYLVLKRQARGTATGHGNASADERDKLTKEIQRLQAQLAKTRDELEQTKQLALAQADAARQAEIAARRNAEQARAEALAQKKLADKLRREAERQKARAQQEVERALAGAEEARARAEKERLETIRAEDLAKRALEKARLEQERATKKAKDDKKKKEKQQH
jgi:uncharacterized protein (TIGR03067 family)